MKMLRWPLLAVLILALVGVPHPVHAAGTVTNCANQTDLAAKVAGGGLVTFACGANPVTITITNTLEITAANTTIDGGGKITLQGAPGVRIINHRTLTNVASTLTLRNLTLTGASISGNGATANGAAVRSVNNSFAPPQYPQRLIVDNVTFTNNISDNTASGGNNYDFGGGAIFTQGGYLTVINSRFTGNRANRGAGGAIHVLRSTVSINGSTFTSNIATPDGPTSSNSGYGGALYVDGALNSGGGTIRITRSTFTGNQAANQGGAAYINLYGSDNESLWIDASSFTGNSATGGGMGLGGAISGGGSNGAVPITITNSLFANNLVARANVNVNGASGGALGFAQAANIKIANSTFIGNRAEGVCSNCYNANGGAVYIVNNPTAYELINLTITGNYAGWVGGGVVANTNGVIRNSIIANNTADNGGNPWNIQKNCGMTAATGGNNLQWPTLNPSDSNDRACAANMTFTDPLLGGLGNNGGPTQTIPLLAGSPAINTGDNTICTNAPILNLDQRGRSRIAPGNATCDRGAFEYNGGLAGDTVGVWRPTSRTFFLRTALSSGPANVTFTFGLNGDIPIVGDWDGDGVDSGGVFRPSQGRFYLTNLNGPGAPVAYNFAFGLNGDIPVVGDWDNDGRDSVGVWRPGAARFYLRNGLTSGAITYNMPIGANGDLPMIGDWDGDGDDSPGLWRPATQTFSLTNALCNCTPTVNFSFVYGQSGDVPLAGDWNGNVSAGIGVWRPSTGTFSLRNLLSAGPAAATFNFGLNGDRPVAGKWAGLAALGVADEPPTAPSFVPR